MRLLVTGGRHLDDAALIRRALDGVHATVEITVLIHGGHAAMGAILEDWARERCVHVLRYPANWRAYGKKAEAIRNAFMLEDSRPDFVLALPGGADTRDLVRRALDRRLPVLDANGRAHCGADDGPDDEDDPAVVRLRDRVAGAVRRPSEPQAGPGDRAVVFRVAPGGRSPVGHRHIS
ncbi:MAG: DUF2493 domain-containing protein [Rhodobacteraceae bacterium]|nr:MAG: DUF2493 domain-containing protein [Paracoccaceae bacterium]